MLTPVRTVPPAVPVVTLDEIKQMLHVDHSDDDHLLTGLLAAAHNHLDGFTGILGRALINQTWRQDFKDFSCGPLFLPLLPVTKADDIAVKYYDGDNAQQDLDAGTYALFTDARGAYLSLAPGMSWPGVYSRSDGVSVTFVAGYGPNASDVPAALQTAIMLHVQMHYDPESRERLKPAFDALVGPFWIPSL